MNKIILISTGFFFLVVGIIGILLPVLPTIPFFIIASICFSKSSEKLHNFLLNHRWIGSQIKDYQERKGIRLRVKVFFIVFQWITVIFSATFLIHVLILRILMVIIAIGVTIYILSLKTAKA